MNLFQLTQSLRIGLDFTIVLASTAKFASAYQLYSLLPDKDAGCHIAKAAIHAVVLKWCFVRDTLPF
jgi:hypothetical protein